MEILDDEIEYAIVIRFREMLSLPRGLLYNVSHTYALFSSILCWTLQRIRPPRRKPASPSDMQQQAWKLWDDLGNEEIESHPWSIATADTESMQASVAHFPEFQGKSVASTLVALRNAVAHGDGRIVKPYNERSKVSGRRELLGFTFSCNERDDNRKIIWEGKITLLEGDMRRLAEGIADRFLRDVMNIEDPTEHRAKELLSALPERRIAA